MNVTWSYKHTPAYGTAAGLNLPNSVFKNSIMYRGSLNENFGAKTEIKNAGCTWLEIENEQLLYFYI